MASGGIKRALVPAAIAASVWRLPKASNHTALMSPSAAAISPTATKAVAGTGISCVALDVSDRVSIENAIAEAGPFDVLVNNAGVLLYKPMLEDPDGYRSCMSVMVDGPYHLIRACEPHMRAQGYGRIVNVSSGWGAFSEGMTAPGAYGVAQISAQRIDTGAVTATPALHQDQRHVPGLGQNPHGRRRERQEPSKKALTRLSGWRPLMTNGPTGGFFRNRKPTGW